MELEVSNLWKDTGSQSTFVLFHPFVIIIKVCKKNNNTTGYIIGIDCTGGAHFRLVQLKCDDQRMGPFRPRRRQNRDGGGSCLYILCRCTLGQKLELLRKMVTNLSFPHPPPQDFRSASNTVLICWLFTSLFVLLYMCSCSCKLPWKIFRLFRVVYL